MSILYKLNFITFKVLALANALGLIFLGWIIIFIRKSPLIGSGYLFGIWDIGGRVTHTGGVFKYRSAVYSSVYDAFNNNI